MQCDQQSLVILVEPNHRPFQEITVTDGVPFSQTVFRFSLCLRSH